MPKRRTASQNGKAYEVRGKVTGRNGTPLHGARVVVWWQRIRERTELGATETSEDGAYHIRYHVSDKAPQPLLLVVEALSEHLDTPLFSPVTEAKPTLEIDLKFEQPDQSEWATLVRSIEPLLGKLTLSELAESAVHHDISFLARELNKNTEVVMRVAVSARLEMAFKVPAPAFYAFLRQQVPAALPSPLLDASQNFTLIAPLVQNIASLIFGLSAQVQTQTMTAAVALDLIDPQFTKQIPQLVSELQALHTTDLLNQPYLVGNTTLAQLLDVAALSPAKQQTFAQALATNTQSMRNFWRTLGDGQHGFTSAEASAIEHTLSVGAFVKNFVPLVQTLVQGFASGTYKTLPDLARLSLQDWVQLVNQTGPPPGVDAAGTASPTQVFASVVYTRITRAYPTAALSSKVATGSFLPAAQQQPLVRFFQNNPGLELIKDNIPAYLVNQGDKAFAGISSGDQAAVVANARSFQRVLRVAPNPDVAETLLGLGIESATQIATLGNQQFFLKATAAGLTKPEADQAFQAAAQRYANVVSLYMQLNTGSVGVWPQAMGQLSDFSQLTQQAIQRDQSLATLFGSQDYCATDDCTSILSPAAYLCDLLLWLRNHPQGTGTALDVLDGRRPDIRHLLLNCPNSDTELPYVDLVIELLADKISPPASTTLSAPIAKATDTSITVASAAGFPAPSFTVVIGAEILLVTAFSGVGNTTWTVTRGQEGTTAAAGETVILTTAANPPWKQTSEDLTAAQLSGAPAFFNQAAFSTLFNASYPQTLPYSAGLDELRTYLQQWNLPLWQLRQALLPFSGATLAQQADVAAERFGMTPHAEDLVANANFVPATVAWNIANPATNVAPVPAFLQAANITYESLIELLHVVWVQGGLGIAIQGINDLCETSIQTLAPSPLDAGFLDRAYRFLRLWLATGYKMWELDLLLGAPAVANGTLDQNALVAFLSFRQLQDSTHLAVDQLLAFYQNIDTNTHRDPDGTTTTSLYSRIFLNPTTTWIAPDPDLVSLPTGGAIGNPTLSDHVKSIQPALGMSASDLATLVALTDNNLTLGNLSLIYRVNALAVATKFSISALLNFATLLSPTVGIPSTTLAAAITAAQNTITVSSPTPFGPPNFYVQIGAEILLVTAMGGAGNATWTVVRGQLGTTPAGAPSGAPLTSDTASPAPAVASPVSSLAATLTFLAQAATIQKQSGLTLDAISYLLTPPSPITQGWATTSQMTPANIATALGAVQQAALTDGDVGGNVIAAVAANAHTSNTSGLANDVTGIILNTLDVPGTAQKLLAILTDPAFTGSTQPITPANFPNQFLAIQLFDKVGVLVRGLRLIATDLSWLLGNSANPAVGGLDLTQLPVTTNQPALSLAPLLTTFLLIKLARLWTAAPPSSAVQTLYDVIGGVISGSLADAATTQFALATITGWPLADIESFAAALGVVFPNGYEAPASYDALRTLEAMSAAVSASGPVVSGTSSTLTAPITNTQKSITVASATGFPAPSFYISIGTEILLVTGFSGADNTTWAVQRGTAAMAALSGAAVTLTYGAQIMSWGSVPADEVGAENMAASALGVLKAQQPSEASWLTLAPTLMNPVRENQSAALQGYLIAQRDGSGNLIYGDSDGLFDYFLIDTQMTSCQVTSRVVQAYIAVQIFVERCLMNLEAPEVVVDVAKDDTWNQWEWMSRYRIWEANREVFLYPENWLIESQRPNRTEIYQTLEQEVRQGQSTSDYLETVVLNYIDRLDGLAHLFVTGTCEDPSSGAIYVVARTLADPSVFYLRSYVNSAWSGWAQIPLDIKAHQVIPAVYRGRVCLFWPVVTVSNEPQQTLTAPQQSSTPPPQDVERYVTLALYFSTFRNGSWAPAQVSKGKLFDKPLLDPTKANDISAVEALYTLKVLQTPALTPGYGANLWVDVFRLGDYNVEFLTTLAAIPVENRPNLAVQIGRAIFDGRFSDMELADLDIVVNGTEHYLFSYAQSTYGPDAQPLLPLTAWDPDLVGEPNLVPQSGALATTPSSNPTQALEFTSAGALDQSLGPLLNTAQVPFRVVAPDSDLNFDPTSYFFFEDNRRSYYVESQKLYWTGSFWSPAPSSDPANAPYQVKYTFHPFYHAFTGLFWNQLAGGGFNLLYCPNLQQNPDQIDPSGADVFSFNSNYAPTSQVWWDHDDVTGQDRQFLDFGYAASFSVYNWELFYHIPLYIAQLLSQNQQFEDAQTWFRYIFNPTRQGSDPVPQRFWIPKPLHNLTSTQILQQQINNLLLAVNQGNPTDVAEIESWRNDPFNPFLLADQRPVAYMKSTVMSYLDNLIAWGDNLFSSESREALSEATLLYVIASEVLGPTPTAVTPPTHTDESFDQLEPSLDAFANAMVEIENVIGGGGGGGSGTGSGGGIPGPQTFYFKIPSNAKLLGYWTTVADRLYKLRHCQNIAGVPLQLALFDAPIDPGLLIAAQAAGVDLSSVLTDLTAALPNYRFTALYPQALDFVNAVRAYGASLQAALEKADSGALALLQQTTQQQLLSDGSDVLDWQVQQASDAFEAATQTLNLAQQKYTFNSTQIFVNVGEVTEIEIGAAFILNYLVAAAGEWCGSVAAILPQWSFGAAGFGGSPTALANIGGENFHASATAGASAGKAVAAALDKGATLAGKLGGYERRQESWNEAAAEAQIQIAQANAQLDSAQLALQIAQQNQTLHQEQIDNIQKQIDFLNDKFTSDSLYDWMVGSLSATYFQSYQLAYQLCKQVERCYQFELGIQNSSFILFGYWDSLYKGLLAGETLNHDLRRMQASYLQQNARRYELSRFVSLGLLNPTALQNLLVNGACDFTLPESLFDNDYPGHYNRRLTRVSVTVVYPSPGKFDNVKGTLTLVANQVRIKTDTSSGYAESPVGSDPRFLYNYAAVPQKIAMGNAQDDPGLFLTSISNNIADQRYLPFENAGAISSWHLEMPQINNEIDLSTVGDIVLHLYYTALDGAAALQSAAQANNAANLPTSGIKVFSAQNDFVAPPVSGADPKPVAPWQGFLYPPTAGANQVLTLPIYASKFPAWTRGKTITVTSLTVLVVAWPPGTFVLVPQAPLPTTPITMTPVAGVSEPTVVSATIASPGAVPATWSFEIQQQGAGNFTSLTPDTIGDVLLLVSFSL